MRQAAIAGVLGLSRARVAALCLSLLAATALAVTQPGTARAADYPGQAEIDAAQAAADSQASTVAQLDAAVVSLEQALGAALDNEALVSDRYVQALGELDSANAALDAANQRSAAAQAELTAARNDLASVAMAAYRDGGNMNQITAVLSATGFADAVAKSEALTRTSDEISVKVQRVEAAHLVADTMQTLADAAATRAADAEQAAKTALDAATAASAAAKVAVADAATAKTAATKRLAELQHTTVALEQQRQAGLAAEREAARKAAALKAQQAADAAYKAQQDALKKQQEAAAQAAAAAAAKKAAEQAAATTTSNTTGPSGGSTTASGGSGGSTTTTTSGGSGGSTPASTADPAPAPAPAPDPIVGAWRSTAAQGETAVAKALTMLGVPYLLGGNSMSGFDCSYLTMTSWKAAGFYIPRSAQWQYNALTHVPISQMRKGDLIFYGTNRSDTQIYHVAIYIGNGLVAEAASPGTDSLIRAYDAFWRIDNLIPYVGRP